MRDYISQSQITLFRDCDYKYAMRYKYNKESIIWDPTIMDVGRYVHDACDDYYKKYWDPTRTEEEILYYSYECLKKRWDRWLKPELLLKAYKCMEGFAKFEIKNINNGIVTQPETEMTIEVDGLLGIIDYMNVYPDRIRAVEYKTGAKPTLGFYNKLQAVMYRRLIEKKYGIKIKEFEFEFPLPNETRIVKFDNKTDKVEKEMDDLINRIRKAWKKDVFVKKPRTPSGCKWCEYKYYCGGI